MHSAASGRIIGPGSMHVTCCKTLIEDLNPSVAFTMSSPGVIPTALITEVSDCSS